MPSQNFDALLAAYVDAVAHNARIEGIESVGSWHDYERVDEAAAKAALYAKIDVPRALTDPLLLALREAANTAPQDIAVTLEEARDEIISLRRMPAKSTIHLVVRRVVDSYESGNPAWSVHLAMRALRRALDADGEA